MTTPRIAHYYHHAPSGKTVTLRAVNIERDLVKLHVWAHLPHVMTNWTLNKPLDELRRHFYKILTDTNMSAFIAAIDGCEIGYTETYYAPDDRLANFCKVSDGDYGLHLFIGPADALGKGYSELILCALTDYLFVRHRARRVLVEPNHKVQQLTILERKLGFTNLGLLQLPEKTATLYAADAASFYQRYPFTMPSTQQGIHCDAAEWPLLRLHFNDHPRDDDVKSWLANVDILLARRERFVVISTFGEHYQYSPAARRYQALWFKQNTDALASCIAMVRVTRDAEMRAKITSNAMRKGMPFVCIPAHSIPEAEAIAARLIRKVHTS
jgi:RimJ/RimL family protein N-acetyltransferase